MRFPRYQIAIIHVSAATDIVLQRAQKRGEVTGRFVPNDVLIQSIKAVPKSVGILEPLTDFTAHVLNEGAEPSLYTVSKRSGDREVASITLATRQHCGTGMKILGSWNEIASRFVTNKFLLDSHLGQEVSKTLDQYFAKDIGIVLFSKSYCSYCLRIKSILHAAGFRDYLLVELDRLDEGIALQDCLQQRSGIMTVPQLFSGCALVATCERFDPFSTMAGKAQHLVRLVYRHSDHNCELKPSFAITRPCFDDSSDTIYLLVGGVYRDGIACRVCMYSQKVETLYSSCDIDYTPVLINFNDKPAWFLKEASVDATTPVARHRGKWISGSATLLQYCYYQYPSRMQRIISVAPAFPDAALTAITEAMEAWIVIDKELEGGQEGWFVARQHYLATLKPLQERLENSKYICSNDHPGREDFVWFPAVDSTFVYLSSLCQFKVNDVVKVHAWVQRMAALPSVARCATANSTKIRVNRLIGKLKDKCPWMESMMLPDKVLIRDRMLVKGNSSSGSGGGGHVEICI